MSHNIITNSEKIIISGKTCDNIINCKLQIDELHKKYNEITLDFPIHSMANFRDSLIHFDKLYMSIDESEINCQRYALNEHLQRCIKDACVHLANFYCSVATPIIEAESLFYKGDVEFQQKKQTSIDNCKFIFDVVPELKTDLKHLTVANLNIILTYIQDNSTLTREHIKSCILDYYYNNLYEILGVSSIKQLRDILCKLDDYVLETREASLQLVKTYTEHEQTGFADFIDIIDELYDYLKSNYLLALIYLLPVCSYSIIS